jgi:hypothetical protein
MTVREDYYSAVARQINAVMFGTHLDDRRKRKRLYKCKYRSWRNGSDKALRTMRRVCFLPPPPY